MDITALLEIKHKKIPRTHIVFTEKTFKWCQLPYPNHPNGCPNFGRNELCPPKTELKEEFIKKFNHFYLIYGIFDFETYLTEMKRRHPQWSERKLKCVLYWQGSVKKRMREHIEQIMSSNSSESLLKYMKNSKNCRNDKNNNSNITSKKAAKRRKHKIYLFSSGSGFKVNNLKQKRIYSMEAVGMNVFKILKKSGIDFETKPKTKINIVNLLCSFKPIY